MAAEFDEATAIAQTERIGLGDLVIAAVLSAVTWALLTLWSFPTLHPGVWADTVVAADVRPAVAVVPGFGVFLTSLVYRVFGTEHGAYAQILFGRILLSLLVPFAYVFLREVLVFIMRTRPQHSRRRTLVMRISALLGALAFGFSDPVWMTGQALSETGVKLFMTLAAVECYFAFLRKGTLGFAYVCALLFGLLAAETPVGFILPVVFVALYVFILKVVPALESPFLKPAVIEVCKWHLTFIFMLGLLGGIALNCGTFIVHHGLGAVDKSLGALPLDYLLGYWAEIAEAASPAGWIFWIGICLAPFVVTAIRFPAAADEERFLHYATGLVFFFCAILVLTQFGFLPALWFWTYFPTGTDYFLAFGLLLCAITLAGSLTILGVDGLCRNHARLAGQFFGQDEENTLLIRSRLSRTVRRAFMLVMPLMLLLVIVPAREKGTTRAMLKLIDEAIATVIREAGDARWLLTDGSLDKGVELAAARSGRRLDCLSLLGENTPMAIHLRTRGMTDDEDIFSFGRDTGMGLRGWIRDRTNQLAQAGVQMGFDLWKRDGKPMPPIGGILSRPTGYPDEAARRNDVAAARDLARRMLAVHHRRGGIRTCTEQATRQAFLSVQWRLSRMCTYRAEAEDAAGLVDDAIADVELARKLDQANPSFRNLMSILQKRNEQLMQKLTPREGLQLALVRADFTLGKLYAETILGSDPENPDANFAMGMHYMTERQYARAESYLKRCLIRKPEEPAVFNNLAMIQIERGKFDAAAANLKKALELVPGAAAVLDTQKLLKERLARRDGTAEKPKADGGPSAQK